MRALLIPTAACLLATFSARAAESVPAQAKTEPNCIEVEVNGQRTPAYDCLTEKLSTTAASANRGRPDPRLKSEQIATRPANEIALFNRAATSQRMGNTFGESVHPQRPPVAAPVSPIIKRPE